MLAIIVFHPVACIVYRTKTFVLDRGVGFTRLASQQLGQFEIRPRSRTYQDFEHEIFLNCELLPGSPTVAVY
jgi:hypothetical protein